MFETPMEVATVMTQEAIANVYQSLPDGNRKFVAITTNIVQGIEGGTHLRTIDMYGRTVSHVAPEGNTLIVVNVQVTFPKRTGGSVYGTFQHVHCLDVSDVEQRAAFVRSLLQNVVVSMADFWTLHNG